MPPDVILNETVILRFACRGTYRKYARHLGMLNGRCERKGEKRSVSANVDIGNVEGWASFRENSRWTEYRGNDNPEASISGNSFIKPRRAV